MSAAVHNLASTAGHTLVKEGLLYRWGKLIVSPMLKPETLCYAYRKLDEQNLLGWIYYGSPVTINEFLHNFTEPDATTLGCYVDKGDERAELVGFEWISKITHMGNNYRKAETGMAFFREQIEEDRLVHFAQMGIEWAFDNLAIEVIHGATPAPNRPALIFSKKLGFTVVGPIQASCVWNGELCATYVSTMTKEQWRTHGPFQG